MATSRFRPGSGELLGLFVGSFLMLAGCNDESKTSGTMVEVSEEAKAHMKSKKESYKGGPPQKAVAKKK